MSTINKITNANVYLDGTNNLLGKAAEIVLPEIAMATEEHRALGLIGTIVTPTALEELAATVKWNGFYPDALIASSNPFATHKLQVRASVEVYGAGGREQELPLVVMMNVRWKKSPLGTFAPGTAWESSQELTCSYIKVTLDGEDLVELDVFNNVWTVGGVDILARYRANLGA